MSNGYICGKQNRIGMKENLQASVQETLLRNISMLSMPLAQEREMTRDIHGRMPSVDELRRVVDLVKSILFPDFFDPRQADESMRQYFIGVNMEMLYSILKVQLRRGLLFCPKVKSDSDPKSEADRLALQFINALPDIKRVLYTDVEAVFNSDPAVSNRGEVIFSYPVIQTMIHYRVAHYLLKMGVPVIPRIITELAHSATGIDIHPGAEIGEYFSIDHGTGVVIGETCVIGRHVTLYQGVTLGAKNFTLDAQGHPINVPRHPIIEDNVTIYSNASVLGRITVGHDAIIGGNVWVTDNVPPYGRVLQRKPMETTFTGGLGI